MSDKPHESMNPKIEDLGNYENAIRLPKGRTDNASYRGNESVSIFCLCFVKPQRTL
jgi:hypothetical protein